jgi:hypothetical protein
VATKLILKSWKHPQDGHCFIVSSWRGARLHHIPSPHNSSHLIPNRILNLLARNAVVLCQRLHGLAVPEPFSDDPNLNSGASEAWAAKADAGMNRNWL